MNSLAKLSFDLLRICRPRQWVKNLAVFAAIGLSGDLFNPYYFWPVFYTFAIFCLLSSGLYIVNDLVDKDKDKLHYSKKFRPIAHGDISPGFALVVAVILIVSGLVFSSFLGINAYLFSLATFFVCFQLMYSLVFKRIILLDVMAISAGFMMRIFAGSFVVGVSLSSWLILTVTMLSLFLAIGKRRLELTLMEHQTAVKHRDILGHYPTILLDGMTFMMATSTLLTYSLFTFNETQNPRKLNLDFLPDTLASPKWLMVSIPIVIYGVFRYLYIIYEKKQGDSPERVLFSDFPLLTSVILWALTVLWVVYIVGK
jgi:4-hydroxybenzoate polyprenyltransferase